MLVREARVPCGLYQQPRLSTDAPSACEIRVAQLCARNRFVINPYIWGAAATIREMRKNRIQFPVHRYEFSHWPFRDHESATELAAEHVFEIGRVMPPSCQPIEFDMELLEQGIERADHRMIDVDPVAGDGPNGHPFPVLAWEYRLAIQAAIDVEKDEGARLAGGVLRAKKRVGVHFVQVRGCLMGNDSLPRYPPDVWGTPAVGGLWPGLPIDVLCVFRYAGSALYATINTCLMMNSTTGLRWRRNPSRFCSPTWA